MSDVTLAIASLLYDGWQKVRLSRSIDTISGTFEVTVTEKYAADMLQRQIAVGMPVTASIDDIDVITGFIDDMEVNYGTSDHSLTLRGRDATGDLVDCAADRGPTEFRDRSLSQIIRAICLPYGVPVTVATDEGAPFKKIDVQQGETAFELIDRLCRNRAVMPISDGLGGLRLVKPGTAVQGRLVLGDNILTGTGTRSWRERFSEYLVKGQSSAPTLGPSRAAHPKAQAIDPGITRYRPKTILAETAGDNGSFADRALFEANRRAGAGAKAIYTVQGWHIGGETGPLWQPNFLVPVKDLFLKIDRQMLVAKVDFSKDDNGSITTLAVAPPEAYDRLPLPEEASGGLFG